VAGYTKLSLKRDVEDQALSYGLSPNLEFRFVGTGLDAHESGLSYLRVAPGFRLPFGHSHERQEEIYVLVSGSARVKLDDDLVELEPWDCLRIAPETVRNVEAGPEGAELLLFAAPRAGSDDVTMLQGWWQE
jgi:mannose-6-phosphate isomerase-like protein (cupin superfamily)